MQLILRPTRTKNQLYNYTSQKYQKLRILPGLAPELLSQGSPKTRAFTEEGKEGEKTGREGERHPDGIHQTGFLGVPTLSGLCKGSACTCTHRAPRVPRPGLNFSYSKYAHHIFHSNNNNSSHGAGAGAALLCMYRDGLKGGPVSLSNSQAGPGRNFSQLRAHLLVHLCSS